MTPTMSSDLETLENTTFASCLCVQLLENRTVIPFCFYIEIKMEESTMTSG